MSLFSPPPDLPSHLAPLWAWIWLQRLVLKAWIRATYGAGTPFRWGVLNNGRVVLLNVVPKGSEPKWERPVDPYDRIKAAMDGRLFTPAYTRNPVICADLGTGLRPGSQNAILIVRESDHRRDERLLARLPLPET
jgi:hypothetical protein